MLLPIPKKLKVCKTYLVFALYLFACVSLQPEFHPGLYIDSQADIDIKGRATTIDRLTTMDWFIEVHMLFHLVQETLYLCVNIIDCYGAMKPVKQAHFQFVGTG
jgi:hypothetical protein